MSQSDRPRADSGAEPAARSPWNRRNVLKLGAFGAGAAVVGYPLVRVGMWWNRRAGEGLEALAVEEFQIVESMAEAMFPPGGPLVYSGKDYNVAHFIDGQVAGMDPDLRRVMKAAIHALEDMTIVEEFDWDLTPFTSRPLEERTAILHDWERSPAVFQRQIIRLFKWYICMGLCEVPGNLELLGVDYLCS